MGRAFFLRLIHSLLTLFLLASAVFWLSRLVGDPVDLLIPPDVVEIQEARERFEHRYGLDKPVIVQYGIYLLGLFKGDFGNSVYFGHAPVANIVARALWNTLPLALLAFAIMIVVAVPLGVLSALYRGTWIDSLFQTVATLGLTVPNFWLALVLMWLFAVNFEIFPPGGKSGFMSYVLPAIVIPAFGIGGMARLLRSSMLEVLGSQYITVARAKGLSERLVIVRHALKNALLPTVTFGGLAFAGMLNGSMLVETVYSWPGLGNVTLQAITTRDYPMIQGVVLAVGIIVVTANLWVDVIYSYLNPRIRSL